MLNYSPINNQNMTLQVLEKINNNKLIQLFKLQNNIKR